jgi:error-prone DNA polymerase
MTTLALTDRDTVAGTVRFATAAAAAGIRPVFGVDVAVLPLTSPAPAGRPRTPVRGGAHVIEPPLRITLLAQNAGGWARLCRLVSAAHAEADGAAPVVSWPALRAYADRDLVVLLGPASEPVRALSAGRPDVAEQLLVPWRELAGEQLRLEAVYLGRHGTGAGSLRLAARTVGLADQLGVRTVLTNAVRYADPDQHRLADVLDAARLLRPVDRRHLDGGERWLKDPAAMAAAADRIAQAVGDDSARAVRLLAETEATGQSCTLTPVDLGLGRPHFPESAVVGAGPERGSAMRLLRQRCETGMVARGLDTDERAVRQLDYELEVIGGWASRGTSWPWPRWSWTPGRWGSGSPRGAPAPAPWSTTRCSSPRPTLSNTGCCSSVSSASGARRCRTSTSMWSPSGAWRCTTRSSSGSGGSGPRSPACPRPTARATPCASLSS